MVVPVAGPTFPSAGPFLSYFPPPRDPLPVSPVRPPHAGTPTCGSLSLASRAMLAFNDWWATLVSSIPFAVHAAPPLVPWNAEFVASGLGPTSQGYKHVSQAP